MRKPRKEYAQGEEIVIAEPSIIQIYHGHRGKFRVIPRRLKKPAVARESIDKDCGAA